VRRRRFGESQFVSPRVRREQGTAISRERSGTRENIVKQTASFRNFEQGGLLPGITVNTSPTDFAPIKQLRLMRFEGNRWQLFGDIITGTVDE
jgi:hypothetical protein